MDLKAFAERGGPRPVKADVHEELRLTPLHCDVWLPTIVAVNGVCTGSGLHFVADADVVVASTTASFLDTHVSVGQVAAVEPITLLPRIGLGNTLRLTVLGRHGRIAADEALRISLVDEVVEPERLLDRAVELAEQAATGSPAAIEGVEARDPRRARAADVRGDAVRLGAACSRTASTPTATRARSRSRRSGSRSGSDRRAAATSVDAVARGRALPPRAAPGRLGGRDRRGRLRRAARPFGTSVDADELWRRIGAAGYVTPTWPTEYGGLGADRKPARRSRARSGRYQIPRFNNLVGVDLAGPAILRWGTEEQKQRFLRPIARYEEIWCQLFSEPGAGSDLAGLATRARARRRHVVGERPEGLDEPRRHRALRPAARPHESRRPEAQRDHRVPHADGAPGRDGAPAPPDHRRRRVLRGLLRRRAHRRLDAARSRSTRAGASPSRCS